MTLKSTDTVWHYINVDAMGKVLPKLKKNSEIFVFYVGAFEPIRILQNDSQHLSFVKDICVVGEKITRNGRKMAKLKSSIV